MDSQGSGADSPSSEADSQSREADLASYAHKSDFGWLTAHEVTTVMISPLRRALRTACVIFDIERSKKSAHFPKCEIVLDLREAVFSRADRKLLCCSPCDCERKGHEETKNNENVNAQGS
jgi:hypothetical protein